MPYSYHKEGDKYVVTKKDTGKVVGRTKGTKEALKKYLAALHINANEGKIKNTMKRSELTKMIQEVIKEVLSEQATNKVNEAYVPSNIKDFAKRNGVSSLVNTVAGWAEKLGKGIRSGTAIGKNYSTLILDMGYQTGDIRINTENGTVTLYDEPVRNFNEFKKVWLDQMTADEIEKDANQFRRESGVDESADYDTAVAFRLVAKGNRDAALEALQAEINKVTGASGRFSKVKVIVIPSKGNPQDIIIKLNGPSAFSMGKDLTAKDRTKAYTNPVIRNNFVKVSPYTPQLTKI